MASLASRWAKSLSSLIIRSRSFILRWFHTRSTHARIYVEMKTRASRGEERKAYGLLPVNEVRRRALSLVALILRASEAVSTGSLAAGRFS